ncbi:hypothetical protein [Vulcanococcus limneticus]|uniref:hypothetical protein n=2 Tax=Vulcanococcus limneticus TaxID=2170428 RepID=UPI0012FF729E|nr:hypothetical protein [Vulcanococcus limneticus]
MQNDTLNMTLKSAGRVRLLDFVVILLCLIFLPSSVIQGLFGFDERAAFALVASCFLCLFLATQNDRIPKTILTVIFVLVLTGVVASMISMSMSQLLMGTSLAVAVLIGRQLFRSLSRPYVLRIVSWFALVLLVGGLVGIVYVKAGGTPLLELQAGYRTTYLYLTTFSFAFIGDIIRPSAIFDEPGAFAMFVAIVTMFNDTFRQNQKLNHALVLLLIFTGSLAGLAMAALYFVASNATRVHLKRNIVLVVALFASFFTMSLLAPTNPISLSFDTFYSDRLVIEDGTIAGDNRSNQVDEFFEVVDDQILLVGAKNANTYYDVHDQSSHPFSILFGYGLIIWLPYATLLIWLLFLTFQNGFNNAYTSIGLFLLLLQRPYLYHMSWSILIVATVWLLCTVARQYPNKASRLDNGVATHRNREDCSEIISVLFQGLPQCPCLPWHVRVPSILSQTRQSLRSYKAI